MHLDSCGSAPFLEGAGKPGLGAPRRHGVLRPRTPAGDARQGVHGSEQEEVTGRALREPPSLSLAWSGW
jgi:hypothetical protein